MPDSTPIYGFTYPCPDETVSSAAFATLANQIDAKLAELNSDLTFALVRPNVQLDSGSTSQNIVAGVDTVLTLASSTYTIPVAGVWVVRVQVGLFTGSATVTSVRARIRQNGVVRHGFIQNIKNNSVLTAIPAGPIVAAAGDVITTMYVFNGAGNYNVYARLQAKLLVRIP